MTWLQERLDKLRYTHEDLRQMLATKGIKRSRATITGWTNEKPISLLGNPKEAEILAEVLKLSLPELLVLAGYNLGIPVELIPEIIELLSLIKQYHELPRPRRKLFMLTFRQFIEVTANLGEAELNDALQYGEDGK